jgi:hypothetical protein
MTATVAGIIAVLAGLILLMVWWSKRPLRHCVCGRCHKSNTPMPRCRLSGPDATAWIEFSKGPMGGKSVQLLPPQLTIGSIAENDVVLSDPAVSERHMVIDCSADRFILKDLGSTNGVYVNGIRTKKLVLAGDDRLTIGNTEAVLRLR